MKTKITSFIRSQGFFFTVFLLTCSGVFAQAVPEYMYYKFDAAGNQQNYASAPVGNNPATLTGQTIGSTGQFGTALIGNGLASGTNSLNTGWATNLAATGWTISFWVNNFPATSSTTYYYFGDASAGSFRCFTGGVAGNGNLWLRGTGFTDVPINGIPATPTVIHLVYTGSAVRVFFNGVFSSSVAQAAVAFSGAGPFLVGGYSTSNSINAGTLMDEFRMYNRALTDLEVSQTWNQPLPIVIGGPPIVVTTAATGVTSTAATLNGTVNANSASTTVSFEYGLTTAYGTTVPGVPATVTGSTVTPVTAALTGLLPGNTYHYRVKGVNSFGNTDGLDMTFTTAPVLPTVVTTAATSVTSTSAQLNGTVDAGGASTAVTFEYGLTTAYGTTVPGIPSPVTGNTVTPVTAAISGLVINTTYHFRVKGVNSVGTSTGNDMTFLTTSCPMPGPAGVIAGPTSVCGNSTGKVYTVPAIANATGYAWTLPAGAAITAGANTNSITVTFGNTSGTVSVYGTNTCGNGSAANLAVTVTIAPVPTITGQNSMCVNSGYFNYTTEPGMNNYTWTLSSGGVITWGAGTNQIQVQWTSSGAQSVSVNYSNANGCFAGTPTALPVTVNPLPGTAGAITGAGTACGGAMGVAYSVAAIANAATYVWSLPAGATIASGALTNSITVNFAPNASSGNITVYGNNLCGNGTVSPALAVTVNPLPAAAGTITGQASVCKIATGVVYSVGTIANATGYTWTLPAGVTITAGANTASITVDFGASAVSGNITVLGTNSCGSGTVSPAFAITVNSKPDTPVVTALGDALSSSAASGNQWYFSTTESGAGAIIPGATSQQYTATQTGWYWSVVTLSGCSSDPSNRVYVVMVGQQELQAADFKIYPVPNDGRFTLSLSSPSQDIFTISVFNNVGVMIHQDAGIAVNGTRDQVIDLRPVPDGVYTIVIQGAQSRIVKKVLVNK